MRSTAFAFLGLTAAAGLTLVAIFAQLNFPLLSPAPLPSGPPDEGSVAEAVALHRGSRGLALRLTQGSAVAPSALAGRAEEGKSSSVKRGEGEIGAVGSPSPIITPEADGGGIEGGSTETSPSNPTPPAPPAPSGGAAPTAEPTPQPVPAASPKPKAKGGKSKPVKAAVKPAKTKAVKTEVKATKGEAKAAKTEAKAEAKAEKTESKAAKPEAEPETSSKSSAPPPEDASAGKGKALGHSK